jgi:hypothetical protein
MERYRRKHEDLGDVIWDVMGSLECCGTGGTRVIGMVLVSV